MATKLTHIFAEDMVTKYKKTVDTSLPLFLSRIKPSYIIAPILRGIFSHIYKESISNLATFNSFRLVSKSSGENFLVFTTLNLILDDTFLNRD